MKNIQCSFCGTAIQVDPQWQTICCPQCKNTIQLAAEQSPPPPQINTIYFQQQNKNTLVTNADYNAVFNLVHHALVANGVQISVNEQMEGVISGKIPHGINFFGMNVDCRLFNQHGLTIIKFRAKFIDAFDISGVCPQKIARIISAVTKKSGTIKHIPCGSMAPLPTSHNTLSPDNISKLADISKGCGILGFLVPFVSIAGLLTGIISLLMTPEGDHSTCSVAKLGVIVSTVSLIVNFFLFILFLGYSAFG